MGTKRKASQASLPVPQQEQQVRRSRRIVSNDKIDEEPANERLSEKAVLNGDQNDKSIAKTPAIQPKKSELNQPTNEPPKRGRGRPPKQTNLNTKQVAKAIIHEEIDFNKDVVPIRTYGKSIVQSDASKASTATSAVSKRVAATKSIVKPSAIVNATTKLSPASRTIKKKIEPSGQRRGNLTIPSPPTKIEIRTTTTPVQSTISTVESGGQKKVSIEFESPTNPILLTYRFFAPDHHQ